jgi:hypothetical protein
MSLLEKLYLINIVIQIKSKIIQIKIKLKIVILLGTRKTGQMCHSVVKISKPYLSYS